MTNITILVATDFSETSFTVLRKALFVAQQHHAQLHVIHVIDESWYTLKQDLKSISEHSWSVLATSFPDLIKKHFHCVQGNVVREIAETAGQIGATMLVIGSSGENYMFKELLVGSTTKSIVRNSSIPVLVIKDDLPLNPRRILIPTNLSDHSKTAILKTAALFPQAEISLLNIYNLPFEGRLKTYGFTEDDILDYQMQIRHNEELAALEFAASLHLPSERVQMMTRKGPLNPPLFLETSKAYGVDLISIHTSGTFSFFAFDLLEESDRDVLIFKF